MTISPKSTFVSTTLTVTSTGSSLGLRPSSTQPLQTATAEPTRALTTSTSLSSGGKAGIAVAVFVCAVAIGALLYLLRRSRRKRLIRSGFETTLEGLPYEKSEMSGHDVRTEMDAVEGAFPQDRRPIQTNELMGRERSELRAEVPS